MGAIETDNGADSKWQLGLLTHAGATGGFLENPNLPAVITVVKSVDPLSDFVNNPGDPLGRDLRAVVLAAFAAQLKVTGGDVLPNPDAELVALFEESEVFSRSKFAFIQAWDSNQEFETESFVINDGGAANAALAAGDTVTGGPFIVREDYFETITDLTLEGNAVGAGQIEGATNSAEVRLIAMTPRSISWPWVTASRAGVSRARRRKRGQVPSPRCRPPCALTSRAPSLILARASRPTMPVG